MASGGCLCGAVRFTVTGPLRPVVFCHCGMCQRWHGTAGAYTNSAAKDLVFAREDGLTWYASSSVARRGFCRICGSSLFWERIGDGTLSIAAGAFDPPTGLKPGRHIFAADKPDWYEIADGLERLPGTST
jgi:hypothetical protein